MLGTQSFNPHSNSLVNPERKLLFLAITAFNIESKLKPV